MAIGSLDAFYCTAYCEASDPHNSTAQSSIDYFKTGQLESTLGFTLRKGHPFPYAGFVINPKNSKHWDVSHYDYVEVWLQSNKLKEIKVQVQSNSHTPPIVREYVQNVDTILRQYRLPLDSFKVPDWWYTTHGRVPENIKHDQFFKELRGIAFENPDVYFHDTLYEMQVQKIQFKQSKKAYWLMGIVWIGLNALYFLFIFLRGRSHKLIVSSGKKIVLNDYDQDMLNNVLDFLAEHYGDSELSMSEVCEKFGFTSKKLASLFRSTYHCTFKQYLNKMRLQEAYRLVIEEHHSISQILFAVGFNSPSHFNRLFVKEYKISPTVLRKQAQ